jgi:hypothetical protein
MAAHAMLTATVIEAAAVPGCRRSSLPGYWTLTTSRTLYTSIAYGDFASSVERKRPDTVAVACDAVGRHGALERV